MSNNTIKNHIEKDRKIIDDPRISSQSRRHVEEELQQLERYHDRHPEDDHDPTPLELFCDENPSANECKIFDV
jgi:hypothetical protein